VSGAIHYYCAVDVSWRTTIEQIVTSPISDTDDGSTRVSTSGRLREVSPTIEDNLMVLHQGSINQCQSDPNCDTSRSNW